MNVSKKDDEPFLRVYEFNNTSFLAFNAHKSRKLQNIQISKNDSLFRNFFSLNSLLHANIHNLQFIFSEHNRCKQYDYAYINNNILRRVLVNATTQLNVRR